MSAPCRSPKHKRESGSCLLDTLSRQPRAVGGFGINPSIHCCPGVHESVFNDSLWAAVGSQHKRGLQVANSCSLLLLDTLLRHAAQWVRYQPLRHMVLGHTNPFSTILCGAAVGTQGKSGRGARVSAWRGRGGTEDARNSSGTLGGD
jgi:hypothetical protein